MLVKIDYSDLGGNSLKGSYKGKEQNFFIRVQTNADNIADAISKYGRCKNIIAFDYYGEASSLIGLPGTAKPVIYHIDIDTIDTGLELFLSTIPNYVRVAFKLPKDYCDMRKVVEASQKYPGITFCGGNMLRLPGANIGCIMQSDFSKRIPESKISVVCQGCACLMKNIDYSEVENPSFYSEKETMKKVSPEVKPTVAPKKSSSSLKSRLNASFALQEALQGNSTTDSTPF